MILSGCKDQGVTQAQLADAIGVTPDGIAVPMRRHRSISMTKLEAIFRELKTPKETANRCRVLWIEERIFVGNYGEAIKTLLALLRNQIGSDRYQEALIQAVEAMQQPKS